ncbi:ABC transporter permease protein [Liquorilactobacillus sucicola DSM 21376 = JCM 15457]|uniref:ABC superfamily ATP binding cassette transporter, membrane protein n=1 Tax=Liquorilactobacillus sucicola DSM 21376 = JCM 15457 TaxID=1423806 RepID=A0A023CVA6_9LACO|nr:hypothetical protein [Liquorilactobacillus sucicola]KRN05700.1 ABC superfamily ATP binding cassette transporter, membrane protein [Liquorilactobacillus sucicola DSM 21376 = JCM 15457]GAJ25787.1 ABC transporter permease protein [Liquorilactobacillus sucicola DSM 21376 = JCM 15457]
MNKSQLWQLTKINLLYANPQATNKARQNGKRGRELTISLIRQYILIGILFTALYGFMMLGFDLAKQTAAFTKFVALFTLLLVSQNISVMNNVFFESNDQGAYLPLPFSQRTIYLAKALVVQMANLSFAIPVLWVFVITGIKANNWAFSLPISIVLFILYLILLFLICTFIVFGLAQTKVFRQHQKLMTFLLLAVSFIVMMAAILLINNTAESASASQTGLLGFNWLHEIIVSPLSGKALFFFIGIIIIDVMLTVLADRWLLPQLLVEHKNGKSSRKKLKRTRSSRSLTNQLIRYNLKLLQDPTLLMQSLSMMALPFIMFGAGLISGGTGGVFEKTALTYCGVFFAVGFAISMMSLGPYSLTALGISLDRGNLFFVQTLPLSFKAYLRLKFLTMWFLQTIYLLVLTAAIGILLHMAILNLVVVLIGVTWGSYLFSLIYYARDWRLRDLSWSNITQLFNRGGGTTMFMLFLFGGLIVSAIFILGYYALIKYANMPLLVNGLFTLVMLALSGAIVWKFQIRFWRNLAELTEK